jgi:dephospho-CoA kinase
MNIGLTGGIGCGKTTALGYFREMGAEVVESDAVVRHMLQSDPEVINAISDAFGKSVLNPQGRIDRDQLARTVFQNSEALALLESIVHPRVRQTWTQALRKNHPVLIVEIPLLFEKDLQGHFSKTICLSSDPEVQKARLLSRGMSESQIQYRKEHQLSLAEKMRRADIIIHNNGSLNHLRVQVKWIMDRISGSSKK